MAYLKFWGVRGSIPTPGPDTVRYGGNTPCTELRFGNDKLFILDAGSGLRNLGNHLLKTGDSVSAHVFISHLHWDHIQGIPFFTPAYLPGNQFTFYGQHESDRSLAEILSNQQNLDNFPVQMKDMGANLNFQEMFEGCYTIDGVDIETFQVNHPGNALGYKFTIGERSLVYISDNEPYRHMHNPNGEVDKIPVENIENFYRDKLISFVYQADIMIHDAQYTGEEYEQKITWGHSPVSYTVQLALDAKVNTLILFHHDPMHDDDMVDSMLDTARQQVWKAGSTLNILAAREGQIIDLD